jgi:DNA mismatch repair protein MLH1
MPIIKLPHEVIQRISAGEVVVSIRSIVKELLENSVDSNPSTIVVRLSSALSDLSVTDDGKGIPKDDFHSLCKKHCTSKYDGGSMFDISTYGFRGEALFSISMCSKVEIESKVMGEEVGYKGEYIDGECLRIKAKGVNQGTSVKAKDIFYNNKRRKAYYHRRKEEINEIFHLVQSYSIYYCNIKIVIYVDEVLRSEVSYIPLNRTEDLRFDSAEAGLMALERKGEIIDQIYKTNGELVKIREEGFIRSLVTSTNFNLKKYIFVLFINGRLVENRPLKSSILGIYNQVLPKNRYPLVYIELDLDRKDVDVNVHPCKKEVLFSEEDSIIKRVNEMISNGLETQERVLTLQSSQTTISNTDSTPLE